MNFRVFAGKLVSRAAYLRRLDPSLYRHWVRCVEQAPQHAACSLAFDLILCQPVNPVCYEQFLQDLDTANWQGTIYINAGVNMDIDINAAAKALPFKVRDLGTLNQASLGQHYIILNQCARLRWYWLGAVCALLDQGADLILTDHDQLINGIRSAPYFKPGFSSEQFFDPRYAPAIFIKGELLSQVPVGQPDTIYIQQLLTKARKPLHLPSVLMHFYQPITPWNPQSYQPLATETLVDFTHSNSHFPETYPKCFEDILVSIIIPTRDKVELLRTCIESIMDHQYRFRYEIVIVDNASVEANTLAYLETCRHLGMLKVIKVNDEFNWSKLNNRGISNSHGDIFILLNNDIEVISNDWLDRMVMLANRSEVGCVGPLLLHADGTIQHASVVLGFGGLADHVYMGVPLQNIASAYVSPLIRRRVIANTGACLAFKRSLIENIGHFDEALTVAGDLEFCVRTHQAGFANIYDPTIRLLHFESQSRQQGLPTSDIKRLQGKISFEDQYFNPNLSLHSLMPIACF